VTHSELKFAYQVFRRNHFLHIQEVSSHVYDDRAAGLSGTLETVYQITNRVLRRVFGRNKDEVTGEWRKLHNEELLYSLPNIVRVVKSRRMRWAGHVAFIGEGRGVHRVLVGNLEER
jgi:hypothetical protein